MRHCKTFNDVYTVVLTPSPKTFISNFTLFTKPYLPKPEISKGNEMQSERLAKPLKLSRSETTETSERNKNKTDTKCETTKDNGSGRTEIDNWVCI